MLRNRRRPGKPRGGPWYGEFKERLPFEAGAKKAFPELRTAVGGGKRGYTVSVGVDVPGYGPRRLRIAFDPDHSQTPRVHADGPTDSKHRFSDGSLCMWYPHDPPEHRWVRSDGLLALIGYAIQHLFREAWWGETGHWLGPEAPHGPPAPKPRPAKDGVNARNGH
jgi:hypothetical protein